MESSTNHCDLSQAYNLSESLPKESSEMRFAPFLSALLVAVAAAGADSAMAQDASSAKAFLVEAYQHYSKDGSGISVYGPHARRYFHSSLLDLVQVHDKVMGSDLGEFDGDIICSCMDWGGIFDLRINVQIENAQRATATVSFFLYDGAEREQNSLRRLKFTLVPEQGQWRIWDINDYSDPKFAGTVRQELNDDIRDETKILKDKASHP
jgi:hypothetical protein